MKDKDLLEKECTCCFKIKEINNFYWVKATNCFSAVCKKCSSDIKRFERIEIFNKPERKCSVCHEVKDKKQFNRNRRICRDCQLKIAEEKEYSKLNNVKKCKFCNKFKTLDKFFKNRNGQSHDCRECRKNRFPYKYEVLTREETDKRNEHKYAYRKKDNRISLWRSAKTRAIKRKQEFTIKKEDIEEIPKICPVFGIELKRGENGKSIDSSPTLDRVDNKKGYVPKNVKVISKKANTLKLNGTGDEHYQIYCYINEHISDQPEYFI